LPKESSSSAGFTLGVVVRVIGKEAIAAYPHQVIFLRQSSAGRKKR
jgi:hypothetical protein